MKRLLTFFLLIAAVLVLPVWGAVSDQQFLDIAANGSVQEIIDAINGNANINAVNDYGMTALMLAADRGHPGIVDVLLKAGADGNVQNKVGYTALIIASTPDHEEVIRMLLKAGADINAKNQGGETALIHAAWFGCPEAVKILIEAGADDSVDQKGRSALIFAATTPMGNAEETVNALIDAGTDVKHKDSSGKTAADYARYNDKLKDTDALKRLEELSK